MLTGDDNQSLERLNLDSRPVETRLSKMMSFEWIGQTLASLCWIISVFVYGLTSTGDWLQSRFAQNCWDVHDDSERSVVVYRRRHHQHIPRCQDSG